MTMRGEEKKEENSPKLSSEVGKKVSQDSISLNVIKLPSRLIRDDL